ncbi:hypothetical protein Pfo_031222, partial [Paulownia fortunei]
LNKYHFYQILKIYQKLFTTKRPQVLKRRKEMKRRLRSVVLQRESGHAMAAKTTGCLRLKGKKKNPTKSPAIRVALPRYGPGFLYARFISSERIKKKIITASIHRTVSAVANHHHHRQNLTHTHTHR